MFDFIEENQILYLFLRKQNTTQILDFGTTTSQMNLDLNSKIQRYT